MSQILSVLKGRLVCICIAVFMHLSLSSPFCVRVRALLRFLAFMPVKKTAFFGQTDGRGRPTVDLIIGRNSFLPFFRWRKSAKKEQVRFGDYLFAVFANNSL